MMITGPFYKVVTKTGKRYVSTGYVPIWSYMSRQWYRQKKSRKGQYSSPLPFAFTLREVVSSNRDIDYTQAPSRDASALTHEVTAKNKCYGKFVDQATAAKAALGQNLAEYRQAEMMLVKRVKQLLDFSRAVKRFDFFGAARVLKMQAPPKGLRRQAKYYSENWLEYHLGWEPIVKDLVAVAHVFARNFDAEHVRVRSTSRGFTSSVVNNDAVDYRVFSRQTSARCEMGADVRVLNPNLTLANQLGLDNPFGLLWELTPWSFVFDWFGNFGQFLGQWSDLRGMEISNPYTTTYTEVRTTDTWYRKRGFDSVPPYPYPGPFYSYANCASVFLNRSVGIASPTLQLYPLKGFSLVRGATAVALLIGFLPARSAKRP